MGERANSLLAMYQSSATAVPLGFLDVLDNRLSLEAKALVCDNKLLF